MPPFRAGPNDPCFCRSGRPFGQCCGSREPSRKAPAGISLARGFLDTESCRAWVARLELQPRQRATIMDRSSAESGTLVPVEDPQRVCHDVDPGSLRPRIDETIAEGFRAAAAHKGQKVSWFETPRVLRYEAGGFYLRHSDSCMADADRRVWYKILDRDLSLLLYLNDDFEGGGLSFTTFHFHFKPRAGDLLIFPSDHRYEHQAEPVKSGVRYVIASWAALEGMKRVCDRPPLGAIRVAPGSAA